MTEDSENWVLVEGGEFWMGAQTSDPEATSEEAPVRKVGVAAFSIGRYPVTVG